MRICFLMISHWSGNLGGAEIQVKYIMDYLRSHTTHELSYICRKTSMSNEEEMPIYKIDFDNPVGKRFKIADRSRILKLLKQIQPDVIYTRVSSGYVGIASEYCQQYDCKLVYHIAHVEDVVPYSPTSIGKLPKFFERMLYIKGLKKADAVIGQATYQDELLKQHYGKNCKAIIPNFHPLPEAVQGLDPAAKKKILWIANLKESKQPEAFLKMAAAFSDCKDLEFIIIGALQQKKYETLPEQVASLPNVCYLGQKPIDEVNQLLEQAYVFVNTSMEGSEGFPNTYIQAWLRKVPVLTLHIDPDNIIQELGLGRKSGNEENLVADLKFFLNNISARNNAGEKGEAFAIAKYSTKNCKKLLAVLEEVTEKKPQTDISK